jgi:general secretion pathway protein L
VKQILRIHIDARWPTSAKTAWVLLAANGAMLREGVSEAAHWPPADEYEVVLGATQVTWHTVRVPPGKTARDEMPRLLAYALEDKLLRDPDSQHFTVTHREADRVGVLVVARDRLRQIVAQFTALGKPLSRVFCEQQCGPASDDAWHLALGTNTMLLRTCGQDGISLDPDASGEPPALLAAMIASQRLAGTAPALVVHAGEGVSTPDTEAWGAALAIDVRIGARYHWHASAGGNANLLHDEFAPRHRRHAWLTRLKPALWLAGVAVAADLLIGVGQAMWQQHRIAVVEERIGQIFHETFPKIPAIEPVAQMQRQLDLLRPPVGELRSNDAMTLLASLADTLGADGRNAVQSLRFDGGSLEVVLMPALADRVGAVSSQLALSGLIVAARNENGNPPKLIIRRGTRP